MGNVFDYPQFAINIILGWKHKHFHEGFWKIQSTLLHGKSFFWEHFLPTSQKIATESENLLIVHRGILM